MVAASLNISIPSEYVIPDAHRIAFETCELRTRVPEAVFAQVFARVLTEDGPPHVVVMSDNPSALKFKLLGWCEEAGFKPLRKAGSFRMENGRHLWVLSLRDTPPIERFGELYILDAQSCSEERARRAAEQTDGRVLCCGVISDQTHWFYEWARRDGTERVAFPAGLVVQRFPDQAGELDRSRVRLDRLTFRRRMHLEDVDLSKHFAAFKRFARERLIIRDKKSELVPFNITSVQHRYLAAKRMHRARGYDRFLVLKSRREGITTIEQGLTYQDSVTRSNRMNVTLAHLADSTARIFRIAKLMHERDPFAPSMKGPGNATKLEFPASNSIYFIGTAGSVGFGRGDTLQRVHGSEVSKWCRGPRQFEHVSDLVAGLTEAASHGEVVLETTAYGLDWFYRQWVDAKEGKNRWAPIFLPWFISPFNRLDDGLFVPEEVLDTLTDEEKSLVQRYGLSLNQIAWRRMKVRELGFLFKQEYPEDDITCFLTSGTPYFDFDSLEALAKAAPAPVKTESVPGGRITYWKLPSPGVRYCIGADTSEGLAGCDENGALVVDSNTGEQVAQVYGLLSIDLQARMTLRLHEEYNRALVCVERNNTSGGAVVATLQKLGCRNQYAFREGRFGFSTDATTRPLILNELRDYIHNTTSIASTEVLRQCMTFKLQSNGMFAGDSGSHDDAVMMAAIANFCRRYANNRPSITVG